MIVIDAYTKWIEASPLTNTKSLTVWEKFE